MRMSGSLSHTGLRTAELASELGITRAASDLATIDEKRVDLLADHMRRTFDLSGHARARWDDRLFWNVEASDWERSQYFAIGNAINFRFWKMDPNFSPAVGTIDGASYRGAMYMWRCLRRAYDGGAVDILDASMLAALTSAQFEAIFTDDTGINPLAIASDERIANLRDLGQQLIENWDGHFFNLVAATDGSLAEFARLCAPIRAFDDPVFKLTMVNAILHLGSGVYEFQDEPLPAIDYHLLRHALRQGMLQPNERVRIKLLAMDPLAPAEAQELRRVALIAFVDLASAAGVSGEIVDNRYWLNRVNCADRPVCLDPPTAPACPFLEACERFTEFPIPIDFTRYY